MWQIDMCRAFVKGLLPFQQALRTLKRRLVPYAGCLDNSRFALKQGLHQIELLRSSGLNPTGNVLEIGVGWFPIVPLLFHIAGARRVALADTERLIDRHTIAEAKELVMEHSMTIGRELDISAEVIADRVESFEFDYYVPWDPKKIPDGAVDLIISRAVFEHVHPERLEDLVRECVRVLRFGGGMCHVIDNSDHWEHRDKNISRLNFLRYEDGWFWRLAGANSQHYQNRLRHSDYIAMFDRCGLELILAEGEPDDQALRDLSTLQLAKSFCGRDPHDLAILISTFVLRRPGAAIRLL